ncbi:hypothetical protein NKG94_23930 [Micromonospora sp. M12]
MSDLLCRVATGGELTTRELYTNDGAHVSDLLVPVWLTSIDSGCSAETSSPASSPSNWRA